MTDIWEVGKDIYKAVKSLIPKYHPHLVDVVDQMFIYFKEKASTPGGVIVAGKTKKAPSLLALGLVTENKRKITFIIEIGHDYWRTLTDPQKTALLDHHLCAMTVTENEQTGATAYGVKPPDFVGYRDEVERWGLWRPRQNPKAPTLVEQMFGKDGDGDDDDADDAADGLGASGDE